VAIMKHEDKVKKSRTGEHAEMKEEDILAVMEFYNITREDAIQYYADEIEAYSRLGAFNTTNE